MKRPRLDDVRVTDRAQTIPGRRGVQFQLGPNQGTIVSIAGATGARPTQAADFPVPPPLNAIGYIALINIGANTISAADYWVLLHDSLSHSTVSQAVASQHKGMDGIHYGVSAQSFAPIVNGKAIYEVVIGGSGAVDADLNIYLVGWVLS